MSLMKTLTTIVPITGIADLQSAQVRSITVDEHSAVIVLGSVYRTFVRRTLGCCTSVEDEQWTGDDDAGSVTCLIDGITVEIRYSESYQHRLPAGIVATTMALAQVTNARSISVEPRFHREYFTCAAHGFTNPKLARQFKEIEQDGYKVVMIDRPERCETTKIVFTDEYQAGTVLDLEHTLENADAVLVVVDDDETGYGQRIELSIQRDADGKWTVEQDQISQIVGRRFDDWIPDSSQMVTVTGTGLEALATALATEYEADRDVILRALQEHDNA